MEDLARWPAAGLGAGMYESFYLRIVSPDKPVSIWIRYTVQKAAGREPKASIWFTVFDASGGKPQALKFTGKPTDPVATLRHLPREWMYRAPIPKTKPESPVPLAKFSGAVKCGERTYNLDGWPGMLGHNWGGEHAWTWVWLNGAAFEEDPDAWIDVVLGRVKVAGRLLPWVANGAISYGGERFRLGGLPRRGVRVAAQPGKATILLPGPDGMSASVSLEAPRGSTVAWPYASPDGHRHDVLNCSISAINVAVTGTGRDVDLSSPHGGTYELGLPERQSWVGLEPLDDVW